MRTKVPAEALACILPPDAADDPQGPGTDPGLATLLKRATPTGNLVKMGRAMTLYKDVVKHMAADGVGFRHADDHAALIYLQREFEAWLGQVTGVPVGED